MSELQTVSTLDASPFKHLIMTIGNLPTSFVDSMSYYEMLSWLCNYLEKTIIPAVNNNAEVASELQEKIIELKSYVDNYFENLDVQEEINNKLDAMAEAGTLEEIISAYINSSSVLGFDNVASMKAASNLIDGSFARTYGKISMNDKKGAFYKIREIRNTDVVDDDKIVSLTSSNNLIAEKIEEVTFDDLDKIHEKIDENEISKHKNFNGKVCYFGDSYSDPNTCPTNWLDELNSILGLTSSDILFSTRYPGSGFIGGGGAPTWPSKLLECVNNTTQAERDEVSAIIIAGGFNDRGQSDTALYNAMNDFNILVKANFPNAQVYLAMIGWTVDVTTSDAGITGGFLYRLQNVLPMYSKCGQFGWKFLENCQYVMHDLSYYLADKVHPNADGSKAIAYAMYSALNGSCGVHKPWQVLTTGGSNLASNFDATSGTQVTEKLDNNMLTVWLSQSLTQPRAFVTAASTTYAKNTFYPFANVTDGYVVGDEFRPIYKQTDLLYEDTSLNKIKFSAMVGFNKGQFGFVPLETISTTGIFLPPSVISFDVAMG